MRVDALDRLAQAPALEEGQDVGLPVRPGRGGGSAHAGPPFGDGAGPIGSGVEASRSPQSLLVVSRMALMHTPVGYTWANRTPLSRVAHRLGAQA